jgi:hypothetical protein
VLLAGLTSCDLAAVGIAVPTRPGPAAAGGRGAASGPAGLAFVGDVGTWEASVGYAAASPASTPSLRMPLSAVGGMASGAVAGVLGAMAGSAGGWVADGSSFSLPSSGI